MLTKKSRHSESEMQFRYERKFHAVDMSTAELIAIVKSHPAHFIEVYPPRWVNNVYFDSASLREYVFHIYGEARRSKVRLRWYGDRFGKVNDPVLEIKAKRGMVGTKTHTGISDFDFDGSFDMFWLRDQLQSNENGEGLRGFMSSAMPALFNRYARRYFESADRQFRITIDTDMSFHIVGKRRYSYMDDFLEKRLSVCELKYAREADVEADRISRILPFRVSKHSKYVYGIQRLHGHVEETIA